MKKIILLMTLCLTVSATMFAQKTDKVSDMNRGDRFVERISSVLTEEGHPLTAEQKDKLTSYMSDEQKQAKAMKNEGGDDSSNHKKMMMEKREEAMAAILSPEQLRLVEAKQLNKPRGPEGKKRMKKGKGVKVRSDKGGMKGNKQGAYSLTKLSSVLSDANVPLDGSQMDRLKPIYDAQRESMQGARQQYSDVTVFKGEAKKIRDNTFTQAKSILTSKQTKVLKHGKSTYYTRSWYY